jgi:uncharacterized membrane protein YGL010W
MEATPPPQQPGPYGQPPATQGYGQPAPGQSPYPPAPPAGGKVKIDTADTFNRIFSLYGSQFLVLVSAALIVFVPVAVINGLAINNSSAGLLVLGSILLLVGNALYTGAVVEAVRDMRDGQRDFGVGQLFRSAAPRIVPLILAGFAFAIGFFIGLILIIIPGLIFFTLFCLFPPAIVIERQGVFGSLQRSRDLVRGNAWRVFGVMLVVLIIVTVVNNLIARLAHGISDNLAGALIGNLIGNILTAPVFALALTVLYFQLRDVREGTQGLASPAPPPAV